MLIIASKIILIITILANILLAFLIFKTGYKKALNFLFGVYLLSISSWAFFILLNIWMPTHTGIWIYETGDLGYFFEKIIFASSIITLSSNFWFVLLYINKKFNFNFYHFLLFALQIAVLIINFIDNVFYTKIIIAPQGWAFLEMGSLSVVFSIFVLFHATFPIHLLYSAYRQNKCQNKQLLYLFSLYFLFFLTSITFNWILPVYLRIYYFNAFGPTISLIFVIGIFYITTRSHFLDLRIVIQKSLIFVVLLSLITSFYLLILFVLSYFFQKQTELNSVFSAGLTAALGIFSVPRLEKLFRQATDKFFFKNKYIYAQLLHDLSKTLNNTLNLEKIVARSQEKFLQAMKVSEMDFIFFSPLTCFCNGKTKQAVKENKTKLKKINEILSGEELIFLIDNSKRTKKNYTEILHILKISNRDLIVPIRQEKRTVGLILLGAKLSGESYSPRDRDLLRTFSYQTAIALEKSKLYEKVKKHSEELEKKVIKRTREIKNMQEDQKQMMIDISHNLQTPLTVIKGELGYLEKQMGSNQKLAAFEKSIDKLSLFIYDLLKLSRLETGRQKLEKEDFNLSNSLSAQIEYFRVIAEEKNIQIKKDIQPKIRYTGDREKLEEVMTNLVSNAIKYIGEGNEIKISMSKEEPKIIIKVSDNGIGITKEDLPHIFKRFYRVKGSQGVKGSGLGLSICHKIIELHDGEIKAQSESNQGSTFTITL